MKIERMNEGFTLQCRWRMQKQWLAPSLLILFPCVGFSWLRYFNVYISWEDDFIEEDLMLVKNEEFNGIFDNDNYSAVLTLCDYSFTRENLELIRELTNEMIERLSYADFFGSMWRKNVGQRIAIIQPHLFRSQPYGMIQSLYLLLCTERMYSTLRRL